MPAVYVIHTEEDRAFVEKRLIRPLAALGFDRWLSIAMFPQPANPPWLIQSAMTRSAAILVVVPASASVADAFCAEVQAALTCPLPVIPVYLGTRNTAPPNPVLAMLQRLGGIDAKSATQQSDPRDLSSALAQLLPPPRFSGTACEMATEIGAPTGWNEETFSGLLAVAVGRHDYSRGDALVTALSHHVTGAAYPYPEQYANADLAALRKKRQFLLMRRYASAVLESGVTDFKVRRQYAQALIELKDFERASSVLTPLIKESTEANHSERFEARGLMGRLLKQRYVDAPGRKNGKRLTQAIEAYRSVFREDQENVWHGINAASCILRAKRDGIVAPPPTEARAIARKILAVLARREAKNRTKALDVWDYATRVEALVDLGQFKKASKALDLYLVHPDMEAFEASSTYRQFDELLQLAQHDEGRPLLDRLARAAERLRSGGLTHAGDEGSKQMLVRVSDPQWAPANVPDLVIHSRLGPIVSITGSDRTIKSLLKDPIVIGVEESRRAGQNECVRSVPFVRVAEKYQGNGGTFSERGDAALVAIIDNGIDVLHEAFLDENGKSRIIGIWDQQDNDTTPAPSPPPGFDFGRYHSQADIAGYVAQKSVPASLSRSNEGHGTHVASIAAGRKAGKFAGGVAPGAQLLIVISGGDEPTGYSHAHLAALSFIKQTATALGKPVVVNLSQGMNAGAHDGRSVLELGFDAFSNRGTAPGLIVVKSAGNERGKRGHAKMTIPAMGADKLIWRCPPGPSQVRLELWWRSASEYRFQLKSPSGDVSDWVDEKNPDVEGRFKKRGPFQMKLVKRHPDNGDNLLKIDVDNGVSAIAPSDWTLTVRAVRVTKNGDIHAWIERGGLAPAEFVTHDSEEVTLSIPGTCDSVITVSAIDPDAEVIDGTMSIMVGDFSSYGPTRDGREKPDIAAPGVKINAARRDSTNDVVEMSGTSMAAPHVTGAIGLLLSKTAAAGQVCPTATQIGAVLREKTINYNGDWDRGQGYGVLDVAALLEAF